MNEVSRINSLLVLFIIKNIWTTVTAPMDIGTFLMMPSIETSLVLASMSEISQQGLIAKPRLSTTILFIIFILLPPSSSARIL